MHLDRSRSRAGAYPTCHLHRILTIFFPHFPETLKLEFKLTSPLSLSFLIFSPSYLSNFTLPPPIFILLPHLTVMLITDEIVLNFSEKSCLQPSQMCASMFPDRVSIWGSFEHAKVKVHQTRWKMTGGEACKQNSSCFIITSNTHTHTHAHTHTHTHT